MDPSLVVWNNNECCAVLYTIFFVFVEMGFVGFCGPTRHYVRTISYPPLEDTIRRYLSPILG